MSDSVLYVFDETCNVGRILRYCVKKNIKRIFLCPLTTNQDIISSVTKGICSLADCRVTTARYLERFNALSFSERDNFIRFISEFAERPGSSRGANLKEYFRYPHSSFSAWWLSLLSEKDPEKTPSYRNLIGLLTVLKLRDECECGHVITDIESAELSRAIAQNRNSSGYICTDFRRHRARPPIAYFLINFLKSAKYYFYSLYKVFVVSVNARNPGFRKEIFKKARYIAITYFPLLNKESLRKKKFVNEYYGPLQTALEDKYKDRFIWLAMDSGISGSAFGNIARMCRELNAWGYPIYLLEEWLGLKDFFMIIPQYIYTVIRFVMEMPRISKEFKYPEGQIDIWSIFESDWFSSFAGSSLMSGLIRYRIFRNISGRLKNDTTILYFAENLAWEKIMNCAFRDNKKIKAIGILHTTVPLLFLPFFDSRDRFEKDEEMGLSVPTPHYLACNGKIPLELLAGSGWSREKLFPWFAIRYPHLKEFLEKPIPWTARQNKILVTLSISHEELKETLFYIHQAFKDKPDYQVIIKGHYLFPVPPLIKQLKIDFDEDIFVISEEKLDKILPQVKAMIVTSSSAALEGIASGCPVIVPMLSSTINMSPLSGVSDLGVYAESPEKLRSLVDDITNRDESPISYDRCKEFIENYFRFPDSNNELIETIEKFSGVFL